MPRCRSLPVPRGGCRIPGCRPASEQSAVSLREMQRSAFEAFVESDGDSLLRIAVLMTSNRQLAEDAAQRTPERLAARWDRVEHPKAFCRKGTEQSADRRCPGCRPTSA